MRAAKLFAAVVVCVSGCSSSTDASIVGAATVLGQVMQASGLPLGGSSVAISCASGSITKTATTDSAGRYLSNLSAPADVMKATGGSLSCRFGAPDSVNGRIRADAMVTFYAAGLPHPEQFVNLKEAP
jgi:hypothetical protein